MSAVAAGGALTRPETWQQALGAFASYLADGPRASSTIDGYMYDLKRIADAVEAGPWDLVAVRQCQHIDDCTPDDAESLAKDLRAAAAFCRGASGVRS